MLRNTKETHALVKNEILAQGKFQHKTMLRFHTIFCDEKIVYLLMECPCGPLRFRISEMKEEVVKRIVLDLANVFLRVTSSLYPTDHSRCQNYFLPKMAPSVLLILDTRSVKQGSLTRKKTMLKSSCT